MNNKFINYSLQISTPDQYTPPEDRLSTPDHTWHGAAIMWHESLNSNVLNITNTHDRFSGIQLTFQGQLILAISLYLPTSGQDDQFLECLGELSNFIVENSSDIGTILIGTDSNCSDKSSRRRLQGFQKFCEDHQLLKVSHSGPTFHHHNGLSSSNIDCFLISLNRAPRLTAVSTQCTEENPQNMSSHDPVLTNLVLPAAAQVCSKEKYSHRYQDFHQSKVIWEEEKIGDYQSLTSKILSEYESYFSTPEFIPLKCQLYSELLVKAAEISLDTRPSKPAKKAKHPPQLHQA